MEKRFSLQRLIEECVSRRENLRSALARYKEIFGGFPPLWLSLGADECADCNGSGGYEASDTAELLPGVIEYKALRNGATVNSVDDDGNG